MSFTATTASLQKRAEEAIRYALEYRIGFFGRVHSSATANATITAYLDSELTLSVGDSVMVGTQDRTILTITPIFPTVPQRYTIVLSSAVTATAGDPVRLNYSANVRRSDDMRSREAIPWMIFVQVVNLKQDDPDSDYFTGTLVISLHSLLNTITAEDGSHVTDETLETDLHPHDAKAARLVDILSDPVGIWDLVKPDAVGRPVSDLGIVAILDSEEPGQFTVEGTHNFETRRKIRLIRTD